MTKQEFITWIEGQDENYKYMLLSRMQSDCDYFLGYGNRSIKTLWAGSVDDQITFMKIIYNLLMEKPDWLTLDDIRKYESDMKNN